MKRLLLLALATLAFGSTPSEASLFFVDLSPPGGALNLGATVYTGDHAIGLAAGNEGGQPASLATGNEVGSGIIYDDVTNLLGFDVGYGSAFGFVDLGSAFSNAHFHAPGPVNFPAVNTSAGVIHPLAGFHTPSGPFSGRITGTVALTATEETDLFDNEIYLNIHSVNNGPGEIRAQLIPVSAPVPEPATLLLMGLGLAGLGLAKRRSLNA